MSCHWVIIYVMTQSYALYILTHQTISILHYKIVICLDKHTLLNRIWALGWKDPLAIHFDRMPWSYY